MKPKELPFVRDMFDRIAPHYDFLNRLLSLRRDIYWRRILTACLDLQSGAWVLDVACGTADVALEIVRQMHGKVHVAGVDFAPEMLRLARPKIQARDAAAGIHLAAADAFHMPFGRARFDALTMAFGIRNIQDKETVLQRFLEQLKSGGRLAILELATPTSGLLGKAFLSYFNRLLPLIGRLFSKHHYAYTYLPDSVARFPAAPQFAGLLRRAGFVNVRYRKLTLGIAVLFVGDKPAT